MRSINGSMMGRACFAVVFGLLGLSPPALASDANRNGWKIVDSVIFGALAHNLEAGDAGEIDSNVEVRIALPANFTDELRLLPTVGGTANFSDGASTLYIGGTLQYQHQSGIYFEGFIGLAGHTADTPTDRDEADLGCEVLFREAVEVGYAWHKHRIGAVIAHYSNGDILCSSDNNDGLTQAGVRYGLAF